MPAVSAAVFIIHTLPRPLPSCVSARREMSKFVVCLCRFAKLTTNVDVLFDRVFISKSRWRYGGGAVVSSGSSGSSGNDDRVVEEPC